MFDRCDAETMEVIDLEADESRRLGHDWVGTEHLLLAFGQRRQLLPVAAARLLPDAGAMGAALARVLSAAPPNSAPNYSGRSESTSTRSGPPSARHSATRRSTDSHGAGSISPGSRGDARPAAASRC